MQRFALMVQGKFMHMYSQQLMENLSTQKAGSMPAGSGATPNGYQMLPPFSAQPGAGSAGMMNGFN